MPSLIWSLSLGLGFVTYGLDLWDLSLQLGFVKYGWVLSQGLSDMGWFFGVCHFGWGLSNMGGICHGVCQGTDGLICYYYPIPSVPCALFIWDLSLELGFVIYGLVLWGLSLGLGFVIYGLVIWDLSLGLGFVKYGRVLSRGLSYMGWFFGVCHFVWGLSNMGGICHGVCRHIYAAQMGHSESIT